MEKQYSNEYGFDFNGKHYLMCSIVQLSETGKRYLNVNRDDAVLIECRIEPTGERKWLYEVGWIYGARNAPKIASTTASPDMVINNVLVAATKEYLEIELFGYSDGLKQKCKLHDWEVGEVAFGWILFIIVFLGVCVFKDWYVRLIIRICASMIFGLYRQTYIEAYSTYTDPTIQLLNRERTRIRFY